MKRTWLIQRLEKPRGGKFNGLIASFAFGGGKVNGGISQEAMGVLSKVLAFDYMGSSEFEFGAVPAALQGMADDRASLVAFSINVPLSTVRKPFMRKGTKPPKWADPGTVYVLCRDKDRDGVIECIRRCAAGTLELKEPTNLECSLCPVEEWDGDTCGWLELDNHFAFFTDRGMLEQVAGMFGVVVS